MLSYSEALERLLAAAVPVPEQRRVPLVAAMGRVLAQAQFSSIAVPGLDNSAMDGYALRCADLPAVGTRLPVSQRIPAGQSGTPLQAQTAARIFTGAPIPPGADAVVMQEHCLAEGSEVIINTLPQPGQNIRRAGEDIAAGAEILPAGLRLKPQDLALAASAGIAELPVRRRLRVGLLSTGDELFHPGQALPPGGIYNANHYALHALLEALGCEVRDSGQVPDQLDATREALRRMAADNDLVLACGGVSVGEEDHVKSAVEAEGRLDLWRVAIKPGKPLAFGQIAKTGGSAGFIGLPGNPVSAFVTFLLFVRPFLLRLQGVTQVLPEAFDLRADFNWTRPDGKRTEFLRARRRNGGAELYPHQGSGVGTSLCWADGLIANPPGKTIAAGETVRFLPFDALLA